MSEKLVESIITAVLAFLLGLIAKFGYDLWDDRRKRKSLIFTKTIVTSFTLNKLEENIRKQTQVIYAGHTVESIHLVRVEVENNGAGHVRNQAFTVRFGDKAVILGMPVSKSSTEDLRYVEIDQATKNSSRIVLKLLQRDRRLSWEFAVINHDQLDFAVEPGIANLERDDKDTDMDVSSKVTNDKAELDLISRIRRVLILAGATVVLVFMRNIFDSLFSSPFSSIPVATSNAAIIVTLVFFVSNLLGLVDPLMEWFRKTFAEGKSGSSISIGDITVSGSSPAGIAIGPGTVATVESGVAQLMDMLNTARTQQEKKLTLSPDDPRNQLTSE